MIPEADAHADEREGTHDITMTVQIEIFWHDKDEEHNWERGWYWSTPRTLSEGPFDTSDLAYEHARRHA